MTNRTEKPRSELAKQVGGRIRRLREQKGWKIHEYAAAAEAKQYAHSASSIASYELNTRGITLDKLAEIADVLDVTPVELLGVVAPPSDRTVELAHRVIADHALAAWCPEGVETAGALS